MSKYKKTASSIVSDSPIESTDAKQSEHPDSSYTTYHRLRLVMDTAPQLPFEFETNISRSGWQRVHFTSQAPEPPKHSLEDAQIIPETTAIFFSLFTFGWMTSLLSLGYTRPLEATDLYKFPSIIRMLKQLQFPLTRSLRSQTTSGRGRSRISGQGYRMRLLKRIFVLDVLLNMRDTGRPSVARVWSLI